MNRIGFLARTLVGNFFASLTVISICLASPDICIDPGHGGAEPGSPCYGYSSSYSEKHVNRAVADTLAEIIKQNNWYSYIMTHDGDETMSLIDRARFADTVNATVFISIHHNSDSTHTAQYSLTTYSNTPTVVGDPWQRMRDTSSLLARKLGFRIRDAFHYPLNGPETHTYIVLTHSPNTSSLTEASFISYPGEADLFYYNTYRHINVEAQALYDGIHSYCTGQGIAIVEFEYVDRGPGDSTSANIDIGYFNDSYDIPVPFEGCWTEGERVSLFAKPFTKDEFDYSFHHWEWRQFDTDSLLEIRYDNPYEFFVWPSFSDSTHWYLAYFSGGPFAVDLWQPGTSITNVIPGSSVTIDWTVTSVNRMACSLSVFLLSSGGTSLIAGPLRHNYGFSSGDAGRWNWYVPAGSFSNCRLMLVAWDQLGNRDTTYSHFFGINCPRPTARFTYGPYYADSPIYGFMDESSGGSSRVWDFGDGRNSLPSVYMRSPLHTYAPGTYQVRLTSSNSCGNDDTVRTVVVPQCPAGTPDSDGDGRKDACDNCGYVANYDQKDNNRDGIGDACCCEGVRGDVNLSGIVDLSDLTSLGSYLTGGGYIFPCPAEANLIGTVVFVDLSDLSSIVSHLTGGGYVLPSC